MHGCFDCGGILSKSLVDHLYGYDSGAKIQLRAIAKLSCVCGYYEIEIPKMSPLHAVIEQVINVGQQSRDTTAFRFEEGPNGVKDGTWGVIQRSWKSR